ncbi:MAG: tetratricopeptide repeat protein [Leptolyngbyaceae cyanobacterium SL_7_1]|nr:tetratricopeptide repeat protein [Leptolyngbyaceae cyanobacterium SL_7_1]
MTCQSQRNFLSNFLSIDQIRFCSLSLWVAPLIVGLLMTGAVRSQEVESFPPNPLEMTEPDPLLPNLIVDRPLSPQERRILTTAIEELRLQAEAQFRQGDLPGATEIWLRELRLRRVLGIEEEIPALSRVGEVAWQENQTIEVRVITERLQQIEQEVQLQQPSPNFDQLRLIAQAYEKMRAIDPAVALYNQLLLQSRQQGDRATETATLLSLGELHLAWFNYPASADAYQQLVQIAQSEGDTQKQIEYLRQLATVYQSGELYEQAIGVQQTLVSLYQQQQNFMPIPFVAVEIGNNYLAINRPQDAARAYQEAFAVSRSTQQYGFASEALQRLATLYRSLNQLDDALVVYQLLVDVERQSYNTVGIMDAHDQTGQVLRQLGRTNEAIGAFRRALQLAQELNYRVSYFNTQIQELSQQ